MNKNSIVYLLDNASNNFKIIRIVAAILVIYGHASAVTGHGPSDIFLQYVGFKFIGGVAVDVFFVISGFFITSSVMNAPTYSYYLGSRILRVFPALIVCVCISVFLLGPILTTSDTYFSMAGTWDFLITNGTATNVVYSLPGVFTGLHDNTVNGSLWSLPVEVKLYIIIFGLSLFKLFNYKSFFNIIFFVVLFLGYFDSSLFISFWKYSNYVHVALMFMFGSFMCVNKNDIVICAPILLLLLALAAIQHNTPTFGVSYNILLPYLVFYVAFIPGISFFNKFGDYSYGIYLYGWTSQQIVYSFNHNMTNCVNTILGTLLATLMGILSWHLVEKNANKLKKHLPRKKISFWRNNDK